MKKIALLGSTGSIGVQVLNAVRRHPNSFKIVAMAAYGESKAFIQQVKEFSPELYTVASKNKAAALEVASYNDADIVFNAVSGFAGLEYSVKAIKAGKNLALANKETLVCGGELITRLAKNYGVEIIPVDSEHSAIWQCLNFDRNASFKKLILTASGGPFRGFTPEQLEKVTPQQALNHPTWQMGKKITIDSATLLNKGYEVIEAHELFGTPYSKIETVIQPTSVVHSLVEFADGAVMAQMGSPDMQVPVQLALTYPRHMSTTAQPLSFKKALSLEFIPLARKQYPLYDLALNCGKEGGTMPCALNAADEVAVKAFLDDKIKFTDIYATAEHVISTTARDEVVSYKQLEEVDRTARWKAQKFIYKLSK
ncbi:MAG: 1-deoxy-D-xylulose-5-phosphate reductoisomerase [Clostridia bacterium]|nr:1-deoxy-D-xylulose-5-phosphate reductoisomerase [Clostridia bacterium]